MSTANAGANSATLNSPPPAIWNLPLARNTNFAGRDADLAALHQALSSTDPAGRVRVIHGMAGDDQEFGQRRFLAPQFTGQFIGSQRPHAVTE